MSNIDDDALEFDDLNMPSEDFDQTPAEDLSDNTTDSLLDDSSSTDEVIEEETVAEEVADKKAAGKKKKPKKKKEKRAKPARESIGLLALASQASPFTVMLAISVLAICVALICLILEWSSYDFNRKPPQGISMNRIEQTRLLTDSIPEGENRWSRPNDHFNSLERIQLNCNVCSIIQPCKIRRHARYGPSPTRTRSRFTST